MDNSNANSTTKNTVAVNTDDLKTALITGSAKRVGAVIVQTLHQAGYNVIIHCRLSRQAADELAESLNTKRPDSARVIQGDLNDETIYNTMIEQAYQDGDISLEEKLVLAVQSVKDQDGLPLGLQSSEIETGKCATEILVEVYQHWENFSDENQTWESRPGIV